MWLMSPGVKGWAPQTPVSEPGLEIVTVSISWLVGRLWAVVTYTDGIFFFLF